ncbi:MAG: hypothetical protein IJZ85_06065 [Lachnospiraceae bacterium]|nr:hypothetical protein [Lachnospiraceae bacterium]
MNTITETEIKRAWREMADNIIAELIDKGIDSAFDRDTYTMWQTLINKPNLGGESPSAEETTLRAFAILILEIRKLIRDQKVIYVNLLVDEKSYFGSKFIPTEIKLTEQSFMIHGDTGTETTTSIEIAREHIDGVELDTVARGFLLGTVEEVSGGKNYVWSIDWTDFPLEKI